MKNTFLLFVSLLWLLPAQAQKLEFPRFGLTLTLPEGWQQVPVLESNQPNSILEAIRTDSKNDFLTLVVLPTKEKAPEKSNAEAWGKDMAEALDQLTQSDCTYRSIGKIDWYQFEAKMEDGTQILIFHTIQHFHSFDFSFVSQEGSKKLPKDAKSTIEGVVFTHPALFDEINASFNHLQKDSLTGLMAPSGYRFTKKFTRKEVPPMVWAVYQNLFKNKSTDAVLVADDYFKQPFALNVVTNQSAMDSLSMTMVCRVTARQFEQTNVPYQEISISPWEKAPQQVFLFKFRLLKPEGASIHYIYYLNRGARLDILKVQMPDGMERELEGAIEKWVLANLE